MIDTTPKTTVSHEITSFLDTWVDALRAKDADAYVACYTDDVRVFDSMVPPQHQGIAGWREMIVAWFRELGSEADLVLEDVQIQDAGSLAIVTALVCYRDTPTGTSVPREMQCRQTNVLRRTPTGWRICHEHSSVPLDHE